MSDNHLPPLPLAEQLCRRAVRGGIEAARQSEDAWTLEERLLRLAGAHLDFALSLPPHAPEAEASFAAIDEIIDKVDELSDPERGHRLGVYLLDEYMPFFLARQRKVPLVSEDLAELREGIGGLMELTREEPDPREDYQRGLLGKLATHALFFRSGRTVYAAAPREANTRNADYAAGNHDLYLIHGGQKIPIKTRISTNKWRTPQAAHCLSYRSLVRAAAESEILPKAWRDEPDRLIPLSFTLLEREALGASITGREVAFLDVLTGQLDRRVEGFIASQEQPPTAD